MVKLLAKRGRYFLSLALFPYEEQPEFERSVTNDDPKGTFTSSHLEACLHMFESAEQRYTNLQEKATTLLSVVALLTPLSVSALTFVARFVEIAQPLSVGVIIVSLIGWIFLLLAFVLILKALSIRNRQSMFVDSVIDAEAGIVRPPDDDRRGRGLVYCTLHNTAINDHVADLVRGSQVFLATSVLMFLVVACPLLILAGAQTRQDSASVAPEGMIKELSRLGNSVEKIERRLSGTRIPIPTAPKSSSANDSTSISNSH